MSNSKKSIFTVAIVCLLAIAVGLFVQHSQNPKSPAPALSKVLLLPQYKAVSGVDFTDHRGQKFSAQELKDHWSIVFFGFTNCPDICPSTMHTLKQIKAKLIAAGHADTYQVLMVTVDPARDTTEQLANYVPFFDPSFIGLRSSVETTTEFARQLGILFVTHAQDANGAYDVDHSTALVLLNPQGEMAGIIAAPHNVDEIGTDLVTLANHQLQQRGDKAAIVGKHVDKQKQTAPELATSTSNPSKGLQISRAWIRPAPATAQSLAAYFILTNQSDQDITIVDVDSDQFEMVMIHDTVVTDGTASMQHRDSLIVPANGQVVFSPMGTHLMLMQPDEPLALGDKVKISLLTDRDEQLVEEIEVRPEPSQD